MAKAGGSTKPSNPRFGWGFFGNELKIHREAAGLSQEALGSLVFCSGSYIGQFEKGIRRPQLAIAERIDEVLKTGGYFKRVYDELIEGSPNADWFEGVLCLEAEATVIRSYAPTFVPGLFQTAAYARAVFLAGYPFATDKELQNWVDARLGRQGLLEHPTKPMLWSVLDESVLRRPVGGPMVMSEQLLRVASLARCRRMVVQVLPYGAGAPPVDALLKLMDFADAPPVAYTEGVQSGNILDEPDQVARCKLAYDLVRAAALSPRASLDLIESVAERYTDEEQP
ncbi:MULTISPECIES: helix-turn-helix domain-containing protein [Streptomyces]|uniref:helix-turn-helix domain-containing protein n=1 Tax=Streptomyces TaxID=1883 RepID=UPI00163D2994|nr:MULTISPECIES: helix-turn-helix transcriptional regulator [Streptomyces]MBC2877446.1 helix-turn-helix transcriptional regulator [Streptomyces sp. TYQ1024]UBI38244.1 helix-turn-helix transcriptional regulator [Streptomyces mobaraensis]UKW30830.1 helix-turn-helix transcriptional regulator [Streptomyces sp. TYQ1024]